MAQAELRFGVHHTQLKPGLDVGPFHTNAVNQRDDTSTRTQVKASAILALVRLKC
jgi:hypothetical protein